MLAGNRNCSRKQAGQLSLSDDRTLFIRRLWSLSKLDLGRLLVEIYLFSYTLVIALALLQRKMGRVCSLWGNSIGSVVQGNSNQSCKNQGCDFSGFLLTPIHNEDSIPASIHYSSLCFPDHIPNQSYNRNWIHLQSWQRKWNHFKSQ